MEYNVLRCDYISGAANTVSNGIVWGLLKSNPPVTVLAYAISNVVAIVDAKAKVLVNTLRGHSGRINGLSFMNDCNGDISDLVTCSSDCSVRVWSFNSNKSISSWSESTVLNGFQGCVTNIYATTTRSGSIIVAADDTGRILLWARRVGEYIFTLRASMQLPISQMPRVLYLIRLISEDGNDSGESTLLLCLGCLDSKIRLRTLTLSDIFATDEKFSVAYLVSTYDAGVLSGHEDWVTCMSDLALQGAVSPLIGLYAVHLLASGSQDGKIRLWKISLVAGKAISAGDLLPALTNEEDDEEDVGEEEITEVPFDESEEGCLACFPCAGNCHGTVSLEALLVGHEDWVTSVRWFPVSGEKSLSRRLFSTSMDRNMILWQTDEASGVWLPLRRMGDIGGSLGGSVGGNLLGFVGGEVSPAGDYIIGVGYGGAFHLWHKTGSEEEDRWRPEPFLTGHFKPVSDIAWLGGSEAENLNPCLVSVSEDQTCRLFAAIDDNSTSGRRWRELSRPQIHGYDITSVAVSGGLSAGAPSRVYVGSEEKVVRVLEAPVGVAAGLLKLARVSLTAPGEASAGVQEGRVLRAYIPELGLSAKASNLMSQQELLEQAGRGVGSLEWDQEPLEGQLADHTLWPESHKLFGHNNDVLCVCISPCGKWLATSCKARSIAGAEVLLWDCTSLVLTKRLVGHESSVTAMRFSPDSASLATGGKDRSICVFRVHDGTSDEGSVARKASAHKRIIWDLCWCIDSHHVLSASRDGTCVVWVVDGGVSLTQVYSFSPFDGVAVTSVDSLVSNAHIHLGCDSLIAVGAESGAIQVWSLGRRAEGNVVANKQHTVSNLFCHGVGSSVRRLRWSPIASTRDVRLASCGDDNSVRIFSLNTSKLNPK